MKRLGIIIDGKCETFPYLNRKFIEIIYKGGNLVGDGDKKLNKSSFVLPVFFGMGIGAVIGLVAYVKDWL